MFAAATGAAFLNGLSRFALMFVFVFYFQGAQGDDPITAGIKLAPMAIGMLIASPLAGIWADRRGSRMLAVLGMLVSAVALAGMTTLQAHSAYWQSTLWLFIVGVGSGMFNSPNTAAMMGTVPSHRRGIAAGARTMLQNTGAVISIAFVLAIVTASVPRQTLFAIFSGLAKGLSSQRLDPFIANLHTALWVLAATSVVGAARLAAPPASRGRRRAGGAPRRRAAGGGRAMSAPAREAVLRIGEVAERAGTTTRTVRYYEEIGLLPGSHARSRGQHRALHRGRRRAAEPDPAAQAAARTDARGAQAAARGGGRARRPARPVGACRGRRRRRRHAPPHPRAGALHVDRQLELVRRRQGELHRLASELSERRTTVTERLRELD